MPNDADVIQIGPELRVRRLGFGTIHVTERRGFGRPRADAPALLKAAVAAGVNFFDTADSYGPGHAEDVIRQTLHPYRGLVIATKGGYEHAPEETWRVNGRPEHLRRALEGSLKRLGVDRIELYQLHVPDPEVPYEDSLGALKELQQAGKIRSIGVSRVNAEQLRQARGVLGDLLVSVQNCYNVFYHQGFSAEGEGDNEEILDTCEREALAFIAWAPLAEGALEGSPFDRGELLRLADKYQATPRQIMLAALLKRSPSIIAIPGTSSLPHLADNLAAARLRLDDADEYPLWGWMRPV